MEVKYLTNIIIRRLEDDLGKHIFDNFNFESLNSVHGILAIYNMVHFDTIAKRREFLCTHVTARGILGTGICVQTAANVKRMIRNKYNFIHGVKDNFLNMNIKAQLYSAIVNLTFMDQPRLGCHNFVILKIINNDNLELASIIIDPTWKQAFFKNKDLYTDVIKKNQRVGRIEAGLIARIPPYFIGTEQDLIEKGTLLCNHHTDPIKKKICLDMVKNLKLWSNPIFQI